MPLHRPLFRPLSSPSSNLLSHLVPPSPSSSTGASFPKYRLCSCYYSSRQSSSRSQISVRSEQIFSDMSRSPLDLKPYKQDLHLDKVVGQEMTRRCFQSSEGSFRQQLNGCILCRWMRVAIIDTFRTDWSLKLKCTNQDIFARIGLSNLMFFGHIKLPTKCQLECPIPENLSTMDFGLSKDSTLIITSHEKRGYFTLTRLKK